MNFKFYSVISFIFILIFSFASCVQDKTIDLSSGSDETLKQVAVSRENDLIWTREIEGVRLTKQYKTSSVVSSRIKLSPEVVVVSKSEKRNVYPELRNFSSLDTSMLSGELRKFVNDFAASVSAWNVGENIFSDETKFVLNLFKYDFKEIWETKLNQNFPLTEGDIKLFSGWLIGEPFVTDSEVIVPLRLSAENISINLRLFIKNEKNLKIDNIEITGWEK